MSAHDEVRKASEHFYAALNRMLAGDSAPMADVWSHGTEVTTMHPIGGREIGWNAVKASFEQVSKISSGGHVKLNDRHVHVVGDVAYEAGMEQGHGVMAGEEILIDHRVTNIYRHEGGTWKLVHHHTDPSLGMVDLLKRLQAKA
jgi:ketosteroid isomerase-like protein